MVQHLREALSRCFVTYKAVFPPRMIHSGALELACAILGVLMDDSESAIQSLIMQHEERIIDLVLQDADLDGGVVRSRVLSCLLQVLIQEVEDDIDLYSERFPPGVRLLESHAQHYAGEDSRVCDAIKNCIFNMTEDEYGQDESLQMYDDACVLMMHINDWNPDFVGFDVKKMFAPILDCHMRSVKHRMKVLALKTAQSDLSSVARTVSHGHDGADSEDFLAGGLHSNSVHDLFAFCVQVIHPDKALGMSTSLGLRP